jgi:hypothetical protein
MYVRIVRPLPPEIEGFDLKRFDMYGGYEINAPLCDLLVVEGYAVPAEPPVTSSRDALLGAFAHALAVPALPAMPAGQSRKPIRARASQKPRRRR